MDEGNELVVVDPGATLTYVVRRPAVYALAQQQQWTPAYEDVQIAQELSRIDRPYTGPSPACHGTRPRSRNATTDGTVVAGGGAGPELALVATPNDPSDTIGNKLMLSTLQTLIADQELLAQRADTVEIMLGSTG